MEKEKALRPGPSACTKEKWLFAPTSFLLLYKRRDLIWQLTVRELAAVFKGSVLGALWAFVRPLVLLSVYTFVFGIIWPRDPDGFPLGTFAVSLFCGLTVYSVFSSAITMSCNSVYARVNFVKQVVFPLEVLPFVQVLAQFILGGCWLLLLVCGVFCTLGRLPVTSVALPLVVLPLFFLSCGLAWFLATLCVYIRDVKQFVPIVLQVLFFVTPIFWQLDMLTGSRAIYVKYLKLNPLVGLIEALRDLLIRGVWPDFALLVCLTIVGFVVWGLGFAWFRQTKKGLADVI